MKADLLAGLNKPGTLFIVFSLLLIPFIYSEQVPDPSLTPRILALGFLLACFFCFLLFSGNYQNNQQVKLIKHPLILFYFLYLFVSGISVPWAINVQEALFEWTKSILFFSFLFLFYTFIRRENDPMALIVKLTVILAIVLSLRGFYELFILSGKGAYDHQASYFIRAYSSNRNLFSQYLVLLFPITVYGIFRFPKLWKLLSIVASSSILILSVLLLTRSVWLALFLSSIGISIALLVLNKNKIGLSKKLKQVLFITLAIAGILLVALLIFAQFGELKIFREQLYWLGNYRFGSSLERIELWKKSFMVARDHYLLGVGPGNWKIAIPAYGLINLRPDAATTFFQRPHNDFIWVLTEQGIIGFLSYVMIFVLAFWYLIKSINKNKEKKDNYFLLAIFFGLLSYLIFACLSFPKERVEHQMMLHIYFAFILVIDAKKEEKNAIQKKNNRIPVVFILLLVLLNVFLSIFRLQAEKSTLLAYQYRSNQQYKEVIREMNKASKKYVSLDTFSTPFSWYSGEAYFLLGDHEKAFEQFSMARRFHPHHMYVLNNLGTCYELKGDRKKAKSLYFEALNIYPLFEDALLNLTAVYFNDNDLDSALFTLSCVSDTTKNARYTNYKDVVIRKKLEKMMTDPNHERLVNKSIERISYDKNWYLKIFNQANENNQPFESAVYREVVFLLESVDSTITNSQAMEFRNKYILKTYE